MRCARFSSPPAVSVRAVRFVGRWKHSGDATGACPTDISHLPLTKTNLSRVADNCHYGSRLPL